MGRMLYFTDALLHSHATAARVIGGRQRAPQRDFAARRHPQD